MRRPTVWLSVLIAAAAVAAPAASAAGKKHDRRGGKVTHAWPHRKGAKPPANPLAKWLASQVGPVRTRRAGKRHRLVATAAQSGTTGTTSVTFGSSFGSSLLLVRSFDIPKSDSDYDRLANLSWTYDNALAALGFMEYGQRTQAEQLLDQLQALQIADTGALGFAYDVATGATASQPRANAMAWVGIAAVAYRSKYGNSRYDKLISGVAKYLLALRRSDGLLLGGPDVQWVSTQHNILAAEFFRAAGIEFGTKKINNGEITGTTLTNQYDVTANAIVGKLLVQAGSQAYFVQGLNDARIPLDVQSLGSVFLSNRRDARATQVLSWLQSNLYMPPRVVGGVTWSGYKPFAGSTSPSLVWSEGTVQADWAFHRLNVSNPAADAAVLGILGTTNGGATGPAGADRAVSDRLWGEFPSWPTSAAGSWMLILGGGGDILFA
ncbi:hypothetical protein [Capillimicrobium parvum]|nr:hypothetical protein [Capillimicrobium parvum]